MTRHSLSKYATVNLYSNCYIELASFIRPYVGIPTRQAGMLAHLQALQTRDTKLVLLCN